MGQFTSYILQSAIVMTMLYLAYKWLMSSTTFHALNRTTLLAIYALSWSLPAVLPFIHSGDAATADISLDPALITQSVIAADTASRSAIDWWRIALYAYLTGAVTVLAFSAAGVIRLWRIIRSGKRSRLDGYTLVVTEKAPGPFSWGRYIILRPEDCDENMRLVTAHEESHLRHLHWADLLIAQVTTIFQWFSPAAWLMMRELKSVHEFQADREAGAEDRAAYQIMLIKKTVGTSFPTFADSLNHSQIKLRITMMMTRRTRPSRKVAALAIPLAGALAVLMLNIPAIAGVADNIGQATLTDGTHSNAKISKSPSMEQIAESVMPIATAVTAADKADNALPADTESEMDAETATAGTEEQKSQEVKQVAIFVNGSLYKGEISNIDPKEIVAMDVVKNDPAYPHGKIMITTKQASDGTKEARVATEKLAEFKGGMMGLRDFLVTNIRYPEEAKAAGKEGRVIVSFTIGTDGSVSDVKVLKGVEKSLDDEAVRVVKLMSGQWTPARNGDKPVASRFTLPVTFSTKSDSK